MNRTPKNEIPASEKIESTKAMAILADQLCHRFG
jgi:hypothetical protein